MIDVDWKKYSLINYYHSKDSDVILKLLNNETNEVHYEKKQYDNYFFINTEDVEKTKEVLENFNVVDSFGEKVDKIFFNFEEQGKYCKVSYNPNTKNWLKTVIDKIIAILNTNSIKHYEADLFNGDNYVLSQKDIEISDKYKILFFDIETKDVIGDIEIGRDQILSICAVNEKGEEFIFCDDDEVKVLEGFNNLMKEYDIIAGYNSMRFDYPYIKARFKLHNIYFSIKDIIHIDIMLVFMNSFAVKTRIGKKYLPNYALDTVARAFIDDSKLEIESSGEGYGGRIYKMFMEAREQLIKYNLQDCKLLKKLDDEFNLLQNEIEVAKLVKMPLSKTRSPNPIVDFLVLRRARAKNYHLPTKRFNVEKAHYEGGWVEEIEPKLYNNVIVADFSSLYPSLIRTFNISPDSLLDKNFEGDCILMPNGIKFSKNKGILPEILDELTELRLKYKREQHELKMKGLTHEALVKEFQQTSIKVCILCCYGVFGSAYFRWFNLDVASTITAIGRQMIKAVIIALNSNGYNVVLSDTDSVGFQIDKFDNWPKADSIIKSTILEEYNNTRTNLKNYLQMEPEKFLTKFIVLAKKKYLGKCVWEDGKNCDYIYYKGIESVQSSQIKITKNLLKEIYTMILNDDATALECEKVILKYRKKIFDKDIDNVDDIVIVKKVGKMPTMYSSLPAHVELAVKRQQKGELLYISQKVPFIVMSDKPLKIIHKNDFAGDFDEKYYLTKQILPPTIRLLKVVFKNENWDQYLTGDIHIQKNLSEYC